MARDAILAWWSSFPQCTLVGIPGGGETNISVGGIMCNENVVVYHKTNLEWKGEELGAWDGVFLVLLLNLPT